MSSHFASLMGHLLFIWKVQVALGELHNLDRCCSSAPVHVRVVFKKNILWMNDIMNAALHFLILILRLTAYVAKVFAMASSLVQIQSSVICNAVHFLIHQTQNLDGSFREVGKIYSHGMNVREDPPDTRSGPRSDQHYVITALYPGTHRGTWVEWMPTCPWQLSASSPCRSPTYYATKTSVWVSWCQIWQPS